jgi:hypothetical protein
VIGFFSRDFYNQITEQNQKNREAARELFMQMNSEVKPTTPTLTPQEQYQETLKQSQAEAERIRNNLK